MSCYIWMNFNILTNLFYRVLTRSYVITQTLAVNYAQFNIFDSLNHNITIWLGYGMLNVSVHFSSAQFSFRNNVILTQEPASWPLEPRPKWWFCVGIWTESVFSSAPPQNTPHLHCASYLNLFRLVYFLHIDTCPGTMGRTKPKYLVKEKLRSNSCSKQQLNWTLKNRSTFDLVADHVCREKMEQNKYFYRQLWK